MTDIIKTLNTPVSKYEPINFRSKTDSSKINEKEDKILQDILNLYNKNNEIEAAINNSNEIATCENLFLMQSVIQLTKQAEALNTLLDSSKTEKEIDIPALDFKAGKQAPAKIDSVYNCVTTNETLSESKIRIESEDMDNEFIPDSLTVKTEIEENIHILSIEENDYKNMFRKSVNSVYYKKITTDNQVNEINLKLIITLPENMTSTNDINEIKVLPFPLNTLDINAIQYRMSNKPWQNLKTYSDNIQYKNTIADSKPLKFNFVDIKANQILIDITQRHFISQNNKKIFYIGFRNIDINHNNYYDENNNFTFTINFPKDGKTKTLLAVKPIYNNKSELDGNAVSFEYFYKDEHDLLHRINERVPFNVKDDTIYVNALLFNGACTPNIAKIKVSYKEF